MSPSSAKQGLSSENAKKKMTRHEEESKRDTMTPPVSPGKKARSESLDAEGKKLASPQKEAKWMTVSQQLKDAESRLDRFEGIIGDRLNKIEGLFATLVGEVGGNRQTLETSMHSVGQGLESLVSRLQAIEMKCAQVEEKIERSETSPKQRHVKVEVSGASVPPLAGVLNSPGTGPRSGLVGLSGPTFRTMNSNMEVEGMETSMPTPKEMKFSVDRFNGTEIYPGLGFGYERWRGIFERRLQFAELMSGKRWPEEAKLMRFVDALSPKMQQHYESNLMLWEDACDGDLTLTFVLERFQADFGTKVTEARVLHLLQQAKRNDRSWQEHMSYLQYLNHLNGGKSGSLVLENVVRFANPNYANVLMGQVNLTCADPVAEAKRIVSFIESFLETKSNGKRSGVSTVNTITPTGDRKCFTCGSTAHLRRNCPQGRKHGGGRGQGQRHEGGADRHVHAVSWNFAVGRAQDGTVMQIGGPVGSKFEWLIDSGSNEHIVGDLDLLTDVVAETHEAGCALGVIGFTHRGTLRLATPAGTITVTGVRYAPRTPIYLLSLGRLQAKGVLLCTQPSLQLLTPAGDPMLLLDTTSGVWMSEATPVSPSASSGESIVLAVAARSTVEPAPSVDEPVIVDSLANLHDRFNHLAYSTILRMARNPAYGIQLLDTAQPACLVCAQGKQTRAPQSRQSTDSTGLEDRIGGVICSDIKGPVTPRDRFKNRYIIIFIDYKTNYLAAFAAPTKNEAVQHFKTFCKEFERTYHATVYTLRTDGGTEYQLLRKFCNDVGIRRQVTEPAHPASNGKAERAIRTLVTMARSNLFGGQMPMKFWSDAVMHAVHVLNRTRHARILTENLRWQC